LVGRIWDGKFARAEGIYPQGSARVGGSARLERAERKIWARALDLAAVGDDWERLLQRVRSAFFYLGARAFAIVETVDGISLSLHLILAT
jgi:hypothetical protein